MSSFSANGLTNKGIALQAKAQAGAQLKYTKFVLGDGKLAGQSITTLNNVISPKKTTDVVRISMVPPNLAKVGFVLSNQDVTTGFFFREIGLFANDPDHGEILYWYANAGDTADYIPPAGGSDIIAKNFDVLPFVGQAQNVTATINQSLVYATHEDVEEAEQRANAYTDEKVQDLGSTITPGQIGAASKTEFDEHKNNQDIHVTVSDKTKWNAAFPNTGGDLNGDMTLTQGKKIKVKAPTGQSIDAVVHQGGDQNGVGLGVGAGGLTVLGGGESYKAILNDPTLVHANATHSTEDAIIAADGDVNLIAGMQTVGNRKILRFGNNGILLNDGKRVMDENLIRINGGKLEYWNGSAWKGVGSGMKAVKASNTVQHLDTKKYTISTKGNANMKVVDLYTNISGSIRVKITGSFTTSSTNATRLGIASLDSSIVEGKYFSTGIHENLREMLAVPVGTSVSTTPSEGVYRNFGVTSGMSFVHEFDFFMTGNYPTVVIATLTDGMSYSRTLTITKIEVCYDAVE